MPLYNPSGYDKTDVYGTKKKKKGGTTAERRALQMQRIEDEKQRRAAQEILRGRGQTPLPPEPQRPISLGRESTVLNNAQAINPPQRIAVAGGNPSFNLPEQTTQAQHLYSTATDPNTSFMNRVNAVASLPGASRTATSPIVADGGGGAPVTGANGNDVYVSPAEQEASGLRNLRNAGGTPTNVVQGSGNNAAATGNTAPGSRTVYSDGEGGFSDTQGPSMSAYTPGSGAQSSGIADTSGGTRSPIVSAAERDKFLAGVPEIAGRTPYNNADPYNLQGQGGPGQLSGLRGRGADVPYQRQNTGLQPTNNVADRYGAATLRGPGGSSYESQVAAAREVNAKSAARANRLAGASEGGDILRQINKLNSRAGSAYNTALGRGMNSKAAARAADVYKGQADALVGADRNQAQREGDRLSAASYDKRTQADAAYREQLIQQGYSAQEADRLAAADKRSGPQRTQLLDDLSSVIDKDGKRIRDPELSLAAVSSLGLGNLNDLSDEQLSAVAPVIRQTMQLGKNYQELTNSLFTGVDDIFGAGGNEAGNVILSDLTGPGSTIGVTDYIAELFDQFGFGNAETVVLANGKKVRKDLLLKGVYEADSQQSRYDYKKNLSR